MRTFLVALVFLSAPLAAAPARAAQSSPRVSVLPFDGDMGPALRDDIVRVLRARGFSTVTSIPRTQKQIRRTVARGFWKHLAKALAAAQAPPRDEFDPAPPMFIDASYADDAKPALSRR